MSNKPYARKLAEFAAGATFSDLPKEVVHQARRCLLDTVGVIIAGSAMADSSKAIQKFVKKMAPQGKASVIGTSQKVEGAYAALANGVAAHALELDDGSKYATYHPGASMIPTALALAEEREATLGDVLLALALGYEVSLRIGTSVNPSHYLKGFHPTGTVGTFGTTIVSASLSGLDADGITSALGIAGSLASGINQYEIDGSYVKHLHPGNAARNGIFATRLAENGFTGPGEIIEGRLGFAHCFSNTFVPQILYEDLGGRWEFLKIYFKPYCSCRYVHYAVEAVENILKEHPFAADDIDFVRVRTHQNAKQGSDIPDYQTVLHARLSLQYGMGSMIVRGKAGLQEYTEESIKDERVRALASKIAIEEDAEIQKHYPEKRTTIVEITDKRGETFSSTVDYAKGDPLNPMSDDDIREKFKDVTHTLLEDKQQEEIMNWIMNEEPTKKTLRNLMAMLSVNEG